MRPCSAPTASRRARARLWAGRSPGGSKGGDEGRGRCSRPLLTTQRHHTPLSLRHRTHTRQDIKTADWSAEVAPFWGAVIQSALTFEGVVGLLTAGWGTIKGALVMPLMAQGFAMGLIKFNLITGRKP